MASMSRLEATAIPATELQAKLAEVSKHGTAVDPARRRCHRGLRPTIGGAPITRASCSSATGDRKSTRLNSSHLVISYAVFCLKKKKKNNIEMNTNIKNTNIRQ